MKRMLMIAVLIMLFSIIAKSQEESKISNSFGVGFQLGEIQDDFGIGLNITSPYIFDNRVAVRARANFVWNEHLDGIETTWTPYSNFTLGVVGVGGKINDYIRLYGEGGVILLLPSDEFSDGEMVSGGYGLFGFEFYHFRNLNYFIEIGGVGTGARENTIATRPIYSNGLMINAGLRVHF
ncbi:MAG: hypothetical protein ACE364_08515 [Chlorobiota bacterium]